MVLNGGIHGIHIQGPGERMSVVGERKDESTIAAAFVLVQNHRDIPPLQSQNWNSQHLEQNISFSLRGFSTDFAKGLPFGRDVRAGVTKQSGSREYWRGIAALGNPEP